MTLIPRRGGAAFGAALALVLALACAFAVQAKMTFPALTGRVVDGANVISPETEASLTQRLAAVETQTGSQIVVVTLPSPQGYEIEEYGYQLGRHWGIGQKGEDDGALLIVAPAEKKVRIEVGYGLEGVLTDAMSSFILQERVLPRFREGKLEAGIVSGADAVMQQVTLDRPEAEARAQQAAAQQARASGGGGGLSFGTIIFLLFVFWILSSMLRGGRRGRRGRRGGVFIPPIILGGGGFGGGGGGWGGGGGFSGGGGSFGGGGASGGW